MGTFGMTDHNGDRLRHGRPEVNGVNIHYAIGGEGDPVILLHGVPKTMFFWRRVIPLLSPRHTVIAVDCRGYGDSERPTGGYDTQTMAQDIAELATHLGFERFRVVGEDWGAAIAYALAAFHRDRVTQLVFQEMLLPGIGYGSSEVAGRTEPLKKEDTRTMWHLNFFNVPHYPELLMAGRERAFWAFFMKREMYDPSAATTEDVEEQIAWLQDPGGTHTILEVYRANELDGEQNRPHFDDKLSIPVLAVGGEAFFGDEVRLQMEHVAQHVRGVVIPECGHNPSLERPELLARTYLDFFAETVSV